MTRVLDYSAPLSTSTLPVPQVSIEALSDEQVRAFLEVYTDYWERIWAGPKGTLQLDLYRVPYYLRLLVDPVEAEGDIPRGRSGLV
jgi:hypothetical protein